MVELEAVGGAGTVTGSKYVLRTPRSTVLLECGLFQGRRKESTLRNHTLGLDVTQIDAVVLSHAHLDHSGALPVLWKRGYRGPIYATPATRDLCAPMLEDAARIQAADAMHIDRMIARGEDVQPVKPLYDREAVVGTLELFIGVPYHRRERVAPGVHVTFLDAGHVLGSAIVVLDIDDDGTQLRLAFTGDLGHAGLPLLRVPEVPTGANVLVTESTYGDRCHASLTSTMDQLATTITRTIERGGKVIIPAFALERSQEVVYTLKQLRAERRIPAVPVYVDSPLALKVTDVFRLHPDALRRETLDQFHGDDSPFDFPGLRYISDVEASKEIDASSAPSIIIAGSGMCEGGRVLHHLRAMLEDPRTTIIIVGYQAEHTLGRRLAERRREVKVFGVPRTRNADVVVLDGLSAHADQGELVEFAEAVRARGSLRQVILVHGEPPATKALATVLRAAHFPTVLTPERGERLRL
ncbi:MAG: MBL fold metallo-hydrolase RNA specificity domain-containing protein [Kofleriaceae bacterium]